MSYLTTSPRGDERNAITYMRLLDADAHGADWPEAARIALHIDPTTNRIARGNAHRTQRGATS